MCIIYHFNTFFEFANVQKHFHIIKKFIFYYMKSLIYLIILITNILYNIPVGYPDNR